MKNFLLLCLFSFLVSCAGKTEEVAENLKKSISESSLKKHLVTLSSDEFQGRKPFTPGEVKTINYLKEQFESYGLKPGNGDSFFQDVTMVSL